MDCWIIKYRTISLKNIFGASYTNTISETIKNGALKNKMIKVPLKKVPMVDQDENFANTESIGIIIENP